MMQRIFFMLAVVAMALSAVLPATAGDTSFGTMIVENPWSRATPKGAKVGAGYMKILNIGDTEDRLIAAESKISERVEIHTMSIDGGIMKMRRLTEGLAIAPKSEAMLKPGGLHLMFVGLKSPLKEGEDFGVTLKFEKAGEVDILFKTSGIGGQSPYPSEDPHAGSASGGSNSGGSLPQGSHHGSDSN